jgi:hypothetical protein
VIRYNHCTDSIGFNNHGQFHDFAWGIYLDEACCGCDVYGNIVERAQAGAMHLHNARENHIYNNIFANNAGPQGTTQQLDLQGWNDSPTGLFERARKERAVEQYRRLVQNPEWKKMRGMEITPEDPYLPDGTIMRGNRIERNVFYYPDQPESVYVKATDCNLEYNTIDHNILWNGGGMPIKMGRKNLKSTEWEWWQMDGADRHSMIADPLFLDAASGDFRLKPGSPALKLGFKPIPFENIGPYPHERRATWPIQEAEGVREHPQWLTSVDMEQ